MVTVNDYITSRLDYMQSFQTHTFVSRGAQMWGIYIYNYINYDI